ncbi:MAG: diaminopimelate decarboxylase [Thermoplasmata archaeon]
MKLSSIYKNKSGEMYIEDVSSMELAERFGTPLYVYSEGRIRDNYRRLYDAISSNYERTKIHFSAKSNTNLSVLRILCSEGACLDAVSVGEVYLALKAGFSPERILFTGTNVRDRDLDYLVESGVNLNVDSLSMLNRLLEYTTPKLLSVRVNPGTGAGHHKHVITGGKDSKFGIWEKDLTHAYGRALDAGVERFGIHMHIGSGILEPEPHYHATVVLLDMVRKLRESLGINFEFIDIGGGIGVPYRPDETKMDLAEFSDKVVTLFREKVEEYGLGHPYLYMEPGRYVVSDAGIILTRVNTVKTTPHKKFVGVDAGFNVLARPAMYDSYHHMLLANRMDSPAEELYDVTGPLCESGDFLAKDRRLPAVKEGDLLAVLNAGAYGFVMASNYNSTSKPPEVLVRGDRWAETRAGEGMDDLSRGQNIPQWL